MLANRPHFLAPCGFRIKSAPRVLRPGLSAPAILDTPRVTSRYNDRNQLAALVTARVQESSAQWPAVIVCRLSLSCAGTMHECKKNPSYNGDRSHFPTTPRKLISSRHCWMKQQGRESNFRRGDAVARHIHHRSARDYERGVNCLSRADRRIDPHEIADLWGNCALGRSSILSAWTSRSSRPSRS